MKNNDLFMHPFIFIKMNAFFGISTEVVISRELSSVQRTSGIMTIKKLKKDYNLRLDRL